MPGRTAKLAAAVALLVACSGCAAKGSPDVPTASVTRAASSEAFRCGEPAVSSLPEWARAGFSPPEQEVAHFVGERGEIVAVPFGWPLRERQPAGRSNKVLWIAQQDNGGPMTIEASREGGAAPVHREVAGGPGPSIIDLPAKGCWRLDLAWPGGTDRVFLRYE